MPELSSFSRPARTTERPPAVAEGRYSRVRKLLLRTQSFGFVRNAALLTLGTAAAQGFSLLAAPLLTRMYLAEAIGQLALFTSFISVASVGISLKYELGIVSATSEAEAAQLTWASALLTFPISLLSGGIFYMAVRKSWLGYGALPVYSVFLLVATLVLIGIFTALRYWEIRQGRFAIISKTTIGQHASRAIAQVALGLTSAGAGGLMVGELIGRMAGVVQLFRNVSSQIYRLLVGVRMHDLLHTLNIHRKLVVYSLPSTFIDTLVANLPIPLLVKLYGIEAGGYFALVLRVLAVPLGLIATSVADTFHSSLATCARDSPHLMPRLFWRTSMWLFIIGLVPAVILACFGEPLFRVIFGHKWAMAGTLAALSVPWFLTQFVVSPLSRLVFVLSGQELKLVYDFAILAGMFAVATMSFHDGWSLSRTVWAFSLINAIAYVLYYLILVGIITRATTGPEPHVLG